MQYLLSVIHDRPSSAEVDRDELAAIADFGNQLKAEGHWVYPNGLGSPETATVVDTRDGPALLTDGPFADADAWVTGVWIVGAPDLDVALQLAARGSRACNRRVEVRPFLGE